MFKIFIKDSILNLKENKFNWVLALYLAVFPFNIIMNAINGFFALSMFATLLFGLNSFLVIRLPRFMYVAPISEAEKKGYIVFGFFIMLFSTNFLFITFAIILYVFKFSSLGVVVFSIIGFLVTSININLMPTLLSGGYRYHHKYYSGKRSDYRQIQLLQDEYKELVTKKYSEKYTAQNIWGIVLGIVSVWAAEIFFGAFEANNLFVYILVGTLYVSAVYVTFKNIGDKFSRFIDLSISKSINMIGSGG